MKLERLVFGCVLALTAAAVGGISFASKPPQLDPEIEAVMDL